MSFLVAIFCIGLLAFTGCVNAAAGTTQEVYSSWTIPSDRSFLQFSAHSTDDCDKWFRCLLNVDGTAPLTPLAIYTGTVKIETGYKNDAIGMTLFMDDTYKDYFTVIIDSTGQYSIRQMKAGTWIVIKDWTASVNLKQGFGVENTISIAQINGKDMQVTFNNVIETTFWNSDITGAKGFPGFIVYVSKAEYEKFPSVPVLVKYTLSSPFKYPN